MHRTRRRGFLFAAAALAAAPLALAQGRARRPVLVILGANVYPTPEYIADNPFSNRVFE
jgi:hypothetical protein